MPIIDIYLLIVLAAGLVAGRRSEQAGRRWAAIVFAVMAVNYGGRAIAHHEALNLSERLFGSTLPQSCDQQGLGSLLSAWPRTVGSRGIGARCTDDTAALPSFLSPLQWRIIRRFPGTYWLYDVDITDRRTPAAERSGGRGMTVSNQWTPLVFEAAKAHRPRVSRVFALPDAAVSGDPEHA
jgi:hypothetical protein